MRAHSGSSPAVEVHLGICVEPGRRDELLAFLREAVPFYEASGGIRVRLIEEDDAPCRFIELVEYATEADYERDQRRVRDDPEMRNYLERWRAILAERPRVEVYRRIPLDAPTV